MASNWKVFSVALAGLAATVISLADSDAATIRLYREGAIPDPAVVASILGKPKKMKFRGLNGPVAAPMPMDGGETFSEEEIRSNAAAAVSAWQAKMGDTGAADSVAAAPPPAEPLQPMAAVVDGPVQSAGDRGAAARPPESHTVATADAPPMRPESRQRAKARPVSPQVDAVIAALAPQGTPPAPESEGARDAARDAAAHAAEHGDVAPHLAAPERPSERATVLAVLVKFANDSARLTSDSRAPLDAIAAGIKMAGFERKIMVEGHANATGSATHNLKLSQTRAEAVKQYLVEKHGIPADLLLTTGYGSAMPLNRQNPAAGENRRVQFRAMES